MADELIITDIYGAGEKPIEGVTGESFSKSIAESRDRPVVFSNRKNLFKTICNHLKRGDFVLLMGAGDITSTAEELKNYYINNCRQ